MNYKQLKKRLQQLEAEGKIDDSTLVCGYADEFDYLYEIDDNAPVGVMTDALVAEKEDLLRYLKEDLLRYLEDPDKAEKSARNRTRIQKCEFEINRLKELGKYVICIGGVGGAQ